MSLGDHLRTLRERINVNQAEVAAAVDVSIPTISEWENGKKKPGRERLQKLARFYQVSIDDLLSHGEIAGPTRPSNKEEAEALVLFRRSPAEIRAAVLTLLRATSEIS